MNKIKLINIYISVLINLHFKVYINLIVLTAEKLNPRIKIVFINTIFKLHRKNHRIGIIDGSDIYFIVNQDNQRHYFNGLDRGLRFYWSGFSKRGCELYTLYTNDLTHINPGDIVLECGANWGDFFVGLFHKQPLVKYYGFEPSPAVFDVLKRNIPEGQIILNQALGKEDCVVKFYLNDECADSSIIEPEVYYNVIDVQCITLDNFLSNNGISKIKLFKLEAEGYEPEILEGAINSLKFIDYIAVDGGYERGLNKEETLSAIINILLPQNFHLIHINFQSCKALFKNMRH